MELISKKLIYTLRFALILMFCVILLGAYTRLKDAGLGCPDWPGCYGQWVLPSDSELRAAAQTRYPDMPIEEGKAWTEMAHRYLAGSLGLLIVGLSVYLLAKGPKYLISRYLPLALISLLVFQALLGMWTVTLKLLPIVVMGHLVGGFSCLSLLWWLYLKLTCRVSKSFAPSSHLLIKGALVLLILQIILGGWTSANYAALVCPQFPFCNAQFWPHFDLQAFNLLGASQLDKPIDFMSYSARTTIHMMHRLGALLNVIVLSTLIIKQWRINRSCVALILLLLIIQISLGIANVRMMLPLPVAVMHNGFAALLLLSLITLYYKTRKNLKLS